MLRLDRQVTKDLETSFVKQIGNFGRPYGVGQHGKVDVWIDAHRLRKGLVIEADVIENENDLSAIRHRRRFRLCRFLRRRRQTNVLRDERPDENSQQAEDGNQREESHRAGRALSRRQTWPPLRAATSAT